MKKNSTYMPSSSTKMLLLIAVLSATTGLVGCEKEGPAEGVGKQLDEATEEAGEKIDEAKTSMSGKAEKTEDYVQDVGITAKIKGDILRDSELKVFQIHVATTDGVVTLSGTLDSQLKIDRAVDLARSSEHVKTVQNDLVLN
jgi:hyperosmotically inducible protein